MTQAPFRALIANPLYWLLACVPAAWALVALHAPPAWVMLVSGAALAPMAGLIGEATETAAARTSPRVGGLLNATLGNSAELIITIVAIRQGLLELVKASITGSILGNLLLVLGMGMLVGGSRHGIQTFDRRKASSDSILLVLAVTALGVPSVFSHVAGGISDDGSVEALSLGVAAMMVAIYVLGLVYGMRLEPSHLSRGSTHVVAGGLAWSMRTAIVVLVAATLGTVWMSEILVGQVEPVVLQLGVSEFFIGIILVPIVGNVAEHLVAVRVAMKNQMSLCTEISIGSSIQVALLVAPLLVFISLLVGNPLTLVFNNFELVALIGAVVIMAFVASDGESSWLEGASLLTLYLILGLAFFLLPQ
jgi:Ca2+:H+ antiporter